MQAQEVHESKTGRRKFLQLIGAAGAISGMLPFAGTSVAAQKHVRAQTSGWTQKTAQTAAALRDLWVGHIFWVRTVSVAAFGNNDAAMKSAERQAVANAQSIAAAIEPFYGAAAKNKLFQAACRSLWRGESLS